MTVYEYLPFLGIIVFLSAIGYFVIKQKLDEYNKKFHSIYSLLTAITDEITKLKSANKDTTKQVEFEFNNNQELDEEESDQESYEKSDEESDQESNEEDKVYDVSDDEDNNEAQYDGDDDTNEASEKNFMSHEIKDREPWDEDEDNDNESTSKHIEINLDSVVDYNILTVKQLREIAKTRGLKGDVSKMKKNDLIESLETITASI